LGFAVLLGVDVGADPPLGPSELEGQLLIGATADAEGRTVPLHPWNPNLISPSQLALTRWLFDLGGASLDRARLLVALAALVLVWLYHGLVRQATGPSTALAASVLLMANGVFFSMARTTLPPVVSILWMLLVMRLWLLGERSHAAAFLAGAGLVWAGLVENGPDNAFFLGSGLLVALLVRLHAWKMPWLRGVQDRLRAFWFGAATAGAGLLVQVLRNWEEYGATWSHLSVGNLQLLVSNTVMAPVYLGQMIGLMPITIGLVLLYFLFFAKTVIRPVARHRRLNETRCWFLAWILAGGVYYILLNAPPLDALVLLVPPLCFLAAEALKHLYRLRTVSDPRVDVMIVSLLIAGCVWFGAAWAVHAFYDRLQWGGFWTTHQLRGMFLFVGLMWIVATPGLVWLYLRWTRFRIELPGWLVAGLSVVLAVGILAQDGSRIQHWWRHRTHQVRAGLDVMRGLTGDDLVIGSWAPLLTLESPARAGLIWQGFNDRDEPWYAEVTHVLLAEGREHNPHLPPLGPFLRRGAVLEPVWDFPLTLDRHRLQFYRLREAAEAGDSPAPGSP
jgi:hypothetical protein